MQKPLNVDLLMSQFQLLGVSNRVPKEAINAVLPYIKMEEYGKRELFVKCGELCKKWFFVGEGLIRVFYEKNGVEVTDILAQEGWAFPIFESYYSDQPSTVNVEALEPCVIFSVEKEILENLEKQYPELAYITRSILKRFLLYAQHRVDSLLFETAEERYDRLMLNVPKVLLRAPSIYIASFLGMTPETLSRVRAKKARKA